MTEYIPKPDPEGINAPLENKPIQDAIILLTGFLVIVLSIYYVAITASDYLISKMSIETEHKLFHNFISKTQTFSQKTPEDFKQFIKPFESLLKVPIRVKVICSKDLNAFALPGGLIILTSGLFEKIESENGLAFILGHELGHFANRDHLKGISRQLLLGVGSALFGFSNEYSFSSIQNNIALTYSRDQETEADSYGLKILKDRYGHTDGAEELFLILSQQENKFEKTLFKFSNTHPSSSERVEFIKKSQSQSGSESQKIKRDFKAWTREFGCS